MYVYIMQAGDDGPVKIGITADPAARAAQLQLSCPYPLKTLRIISARDQSLERWFHAQFSNLRMNGEWFKFSPEMLTIVVPDVIDDPRNPKIIEDLKSTGSLSVTAKTFGVSREWVRQLANKHEANTGERLERGRHYAVRGRNLVEWHCADCDKVEYLHNSTASIKKRCWDCAVKMRRSLPNIKMTKFVRES